MLAHLIALPAAQKRRLAPDFPKAILNTVRVPQRDPLPIPHPPFTAFARRYVLGLLTRRAFEKIPLEAEVTRLLNS